jgi:transposase
MRESVKGAAGSAAVDGNKGMIAFNRKMKVYAQVGACDMRASFDRLSNLAMSVLKEDPVSGHLFLFVGKRRTTCKCLYWDGTGLVLIAKRLVKAQFTKFNEQNEKIEMTMAEFSLFLEGSDLNKRFIESPKEFVLPRGNLSSRVPVHGRESSSAQHR